MAKQKKVEATPTHPVLDDLTKRLEAENIPFILNDQGLEVHRSGKGEVGPPISDRLLIKKGEDGNFLGSYQGVHPGLNEDNLPPDEAFKCFNEMTSVFRRDVSYKGVIQSPQLQS